MKFATRIAVDLAATDLSEGVRAFYLGEGYREESMSPESFRFRKDVRLRDSMTSKVEKLPASVDLKPGMIDDATGRSRSLFLSYECRPPFSILTRVDRQFFRLEAESLEQYLATGSRRDAARRLTRLRRPVNSAMIFNVLMTTVMVAAAGRVAGFELWLIVTASLVVGLLNAIAILGFADIVVEAMEEL